MASPSLNSPSLKRHGGYRREFWFPFFNKTSAFFFRRGVIVLGLNNFFAGYEPIVMALLFVLAYFVLVALLLRLPGRTKVLVPRYEPPPGVSPAVAAWLLKPGDLNRSVAAAVVNMAAKHYLKIEQRGDLYSLTRLDITPSAPLESEERALDRTLFDGYDCFDFDQVTPQLISAVRAFHQAIQNTRYFSRHIALSLPAWVVSGLGTFLALTQGVSSRGSGRVLAYVLVGTFGCFIVTVRIIRGPFNKFASRLPGSTSPRRPWTDADQRPFNFLLATLGGISLLALLTTNAAAVLMAAFMAVNAVFFHALQGTTSAGRKMAGPLEEYRKFLSEVEADPISRTNLADPVPPLLTQKVAQAFAVRLDLGWGEQFVTSIADLIESADVLEEFKRGGDAVR